VAAVAGRLFVVSAAKREQRLVFGEIAEQYDAYRPSYPDALFDAVFQYGSLRAGDRALEIGAGTGKATGGFVARRLVVHALEPDAEMAAVLRAKGGVEVDETLFEAWAPPGSGFDLVYAAQSWHWVHGADRYERLAAALRPGGTVALFWNKGRPHPEPFKADNDAAYARLAPEMQSSSGESLEWVGEGLASCAAFEPPQRRVFTWECTYTRDEWLRLLATHSDHRMLPEDRRARLHAAVGEAIDRHGGAVPCVYDTECFLSRRA
jgi:SAM-dependent methyltransferase